MEGRLEERELEAGGFLLDGDVEGLGREARLPLSPRSGGCSCVDETLKPMCVNGVSFRNYTCARECV